MTCRACGAPLAPEDALLVTPRDPRDPPFFVCRPERGFGPSGLTCFRRVTASARRQSISPATEGALR